VFGQRKPIGVDAVVCLVVVVVVVADVVAEGAVVVEPVKS